MTAFDHRLLLQIGRCPRHRGRGETRAPKVIFLNRKFKQGCRIRADIQKRSIVLAIRCQCASRGKPLCVGNPARNRKGRLTRRSVEKKLATDFGNLDHHFEPVQHRPRHTRALGASTFQGPSAGSGRVAKIATATGIHRRKQLESRRLGDVMIGPRHHDLPSLQRLSQRIDGQLGEFSKLLKERNPTMRQ